MQMTSQAQSETRKEQIVPLLTLEDLILEMLHICFGRKSFLEVRIFFKPQHIGLPVCKGISTVSPDHNNRVSFLSVHSEHIFLLYNNLAPRGSPFWLFTHLHKAMPASGTV